MALQRHAPVEDRRRARGQGGTVVTIRRVGGELILQRRKFTAQLGDPSLDAVTF